MDSTFQSKKLVEKSEVMIGRKLALLSLTPVQTLCVPHAQVWKKIQINAGVCTSRTSAFWMCARKLFEDSTISYVHISTYKYVYI